MKTNHKIKRSSEPIPDEVKKQIMDLFSELELRRQLLSRKIPLQSLEKPFKFTMK